MRGTTPSPENARDKYTERVLLAAFTAISCLLFTQEYTKREVNGEKGEIWNLRGCVSDECTCTELVGFTGIA